jgi:hypothetical protein
MQTKRTTRLPAFVILLAWAMAASHPGWAREYHVAVDGADAHAGTRGAPFRTIQRAADLAQPGDVITVHAGIYRERVNPPRGGDSDKKRIVYRSAPGERVEIRGSEVLTNWVKVQEDLWKATLPNSYFGSFNPYTNVIQGDWFDPRGRVHHTGAVYLNGDWLTEATRLEEVLDRTGKPPAWFLSAGTQYLLNVAWLQAGTAETSSTTKRIPASGFSAQQGVQAAPCTEGGECIGWIEAGDWVQYAGVDFGTREERIEVRASSATEGGVIEVRLDRPDGELLGSCTVPNTGGWQAWASYTVKFKPVSGVRTVCLAFRALPLAADQPNPLNPQLWFARVDKTSTTIWAQFKGVDPNRQQVEINVRRTVFYPDKPGRNFITVRGFGLRHAATPWAPPTAEQVGLIGTHWSKGWIIEDNTISHSVCSGIALGKHGDRWDNTSANTAEGYVKTIDRAHQNAWNRETIGHHVVRNNVISHCEQAGIVGSLGAAFSTVTGNWIHDIHVRRLFSGAEMAGIKFHAAIDCVIAGNHIHRTCLGLWLDWMAQGTQVSRNLFHDNPGQDLFVEVDHGPFVVDNNLFLSPVSLLDISEGGAYAHNLFAGKIITLPEPNRETPYHPAHSTEVAGLARIKGGENRFYNNVFIGAGKAAAPPTPRPARDPEWAGGYGLWMYDTREFTVQTGGNVFYRGAQPDLREADPAVFETQDLQPRLVAHGNRFHLGLVSGPELTAVPTAPVTTLRLGKARVPGLHYENADGSPLQLNRDYLGRERDPSHPTPGPFEKPGSGAVELRVW